MGLNINIPDFKMPKIKLNKNMDLENIESEVNNLKVENKVNPKTKRNAKGLYDITRYGTIKDMFLDVTKKYSNNVCILEKLDKKEPFKEIKYSEFKDDVNGFGTGLSELLGQKGKRVIVIGENTYDWYVTYMSLLCSDNIAVPTDKELPSNELLNVIERSRATAIVYSPKKKELIESIRDKAQGVEYFIEMYSENTLDEKNVGFNFVLNVGKQLIKNGNHNYLDVKIDRDEFKVLLFTSGTTSKSKGVMLCNRNLTENIYGALSYVYMTEDDRFFSVLPLHHTYESTIGFLLPLAKGGSIAVCQGLRYIVPDLKETKPTIMLAVPLLIENLYKKINSNIKKQKKDKIVNTMIHMTNILKSVNVDIKRKVFSEIYENLGGNIRLIVSAAAPMDASIGKWIQDIGIIFLQGYGLTETAPISALTPDFKTKVGSAGKAVDCAEIKVLNPNENGEGEILIKSTTLMLGYYEDEERTKEAVQDGWFHSGDIGYIDEEGFLYITGRCKNVIVTNNGKNIYPEELELMLTNKIPYINECMVYGKEDDAKQDLKITAKITINEEYVKEQHENGITDEELKNIIWDKIKEINRGLTSYKAIKELEIKQDAFEKTTTMKIKRYAEIEKDKKKNENKKDKNR